MNKVTWLLAGVVLSAAMPAGAATYLLDRTVGTGSVTGSITTDDTIGVLGASNITAFNLTLVDGADSFTVTNQNGQVAVVGSALTATATGLFYDFGGEQNSYALFQNPAVGSSINYYCLQVSGCAPPVGDPSETLRTTGLFLSSPQQGVVQFAQVGGVGAVPEPASWAMMILGLGGVGLAMRRRGTIATRVAYAA